jgi:hypothetical protein
MEKMGGTTKGGWEGEREARRGRGVDGIKLNDGTVGK